MKGQIFVDSKNIINWMPENPTGDIEGITLAMDMIENLVQEHAPANLLVDLSKGHRPDRPTREVIINTIRRNFDKIKRIALYGHSPLMKAVAYFIINTAGYSNIHFFSSRQEALNWLEE